MKSTDKKNTKSNKPQPGHDAMLAWDPTRKHFSQAVLPRWFTSRLRQYLVKTGKWNHRSEIHNECVDTSATHEFCNLFDHVGTIGKGRYRSVVLQPYGRMDRLAIQFTHVVGAKLQIIRPGIWNGWRTTTYVFKFPSAA